MKDIPEFISDYFIMQIKGLENPYPDKRQFIAQKEAFEHARQLILEMIKEAQ